MLQTLGLPYKDFGDLSKALYQRSLGLVPGYDVMPPEVRDARISMQRAIWNYCYAASDTAEKEAACRQVLPLNSVTELAVSAPKRCAELVEKTLGASLSYFPRPDAGEPALNANADAWARYETCLKGNDLFGFMRAETNRIAVSGTSVPLLIETSLSAHAAAEARLRAPTAQERPPSRRRYWWGRIPH